MNNLNDIYNIKDYYLVDYGPNTQEEGLKLQSKLGIENHSPRSHLIAPPNRTVKEYMLKNPKREKAL